MDITINNPKITWTTISSSGTYPMVPFNGYFVNANSVILTLPTSPNLGEIYTAVAANHGFSIHSIATSTQVILWEDTGGFTLTSGVGTSASIEIIYTGMLFGSPLKQTFIAKSTNAVPFAVAP